MQFIYKHYKEIIFRIIMAIVCGFVPIMCSIIFCAFLGEHLQNIYLPNTSCSDDIFYFKMVEGMVNFGYPLGYFGYNESRAMVLSFGVWSPMLLLPWALWGKVFGWSYFSPIMCNICFVSIGFIIFSILAKPTWKQLFSIALQFLFVTPFVRYVLSGMPEAICYALIIIMYGMVFSYFKHENTYKLIMIFLLITVLSLMRPYFMVFLLLPGILWVRKSKIGGLFGTACIVAINLLGYKLMTYFFGAPYFYNSMATDFIDSFRSEGFFAGCLFLINKICDKLSIIKWNMLLGMREGFTDGQIYFACCMVMLLLFIWLFFDFFVRKRNNGMKNVVQNMVLESSLLASFVIMLLAIIVLYQISEGSRHILSFLVGFILVSSMREHYAFGKNLLIMVVFVYLFIIKYDNDSGYQVPYSGEDVIQEVENWSNAFDSCISLNDTNAPSFDNVVDWVIEDNVDGEKKEVPWRVLFALPKGTGISCCLPQYIAQNIDELNGRYIITVSNGQIDLLCQTKEMGELLRNDYFVLYRRY